MSFSYEFMISIDQSFFWRLILQDIYFDGLFGFSKINELLCIIIGGLPMSNQSVLRSMIVGTIPSHFHQIMIWTNYANLTLILIIFCSLFTIYWFFDHKYEKICFMFYLSVCMIKDSICNLQHKTHHKTHKHDELKNEEKRNPTRNHES